MSPEGSRCGVHPDRPAAGTCEHCGTFSCGTCLGWIGNRTICSACVQDGRVTVFGVPWDQRAEIGVARAWARTAAMMFVRPVEFFRKLDPHGPLGEAVLFAAVSGTVVSLLFAVLTLVFGALLGAAVVFGGTPMGPTELLILGIMAAVFIIMPPISLILGNFVWGAMHHGSMRVVGAGTAGFGATMRVCLFGTAYQTIQWIPCILLCSPLNLATTIGYLVMWGIGYSQVHEQDGWRSAFGIVLPGLICCFSYIGFYVVLILVESL